mmetsp:Transcript_9676/g.16101  ORF Transcript_9676/g.16101 Transcript_9676/m.16101 type:complete len:134 (-) Transcript_9676:360-761(-)
MKKQESANRADACDPKWTDCQEAEEPDIPEVLELAIRQCTSANRDVPPNHGISYTRIVDDPQHYSVSYFFLAAAFFASFLATSSSGIDALLRWSTSSRTSMRSTICFPVLSSIQHDKQPPYGISSVSRSNRIP